MAMFLVVLRRSGPKWDPSRRLEEQSGWPEHAAFMDGLVESGLLLLGGPLADEQRVMYTAETESEDALRAALARDPWNDVESVTLCGFNTNYVAPGGGRRVEELVLFQHKLR